MAVAGTPKDDTGLERKMESRHLTMISLGGVIGTGHCYPVLAELGGGARIGVHGGLAADAAMVSSFAVLGVVGRVHCGGVRAWYGRWPRSG